MSEAQRPTIVITGATRGIGLLLARYFASENWSVAICARDEASVIEVSRDIASEFGVPTVGGCADVGDPNDMASFAETVRAQLGPTTALICNAGVLGPVGSPKHVDAESWSSAINVNVAGSFNAIKAFWNDLQNSPIGRIILMSGGGVGGPNPMKRASAYVASKAAVSSLAESIATDLEGTSCTINAVAPGAFPTSFMADVLDVGTEVAGHELYVDASGRTGHIAPGSASKLLELVEFLVSPLSGHINGRTLSANWNRVDGLQKGAFDDDDQNYLRMRRIDNDLFWSVKS